MTCGGSVFRVCGWRNESQCLGRMGLRGLPSACILTHTTDVGSEQGQPPLNTSCAALVKMPCLSRIHEVKNRGRSRGMSAYTEGNSPRLKFLLFKKENKNL